MDLRLATPAEIDTVLADLYDREFDLKATIRLIDSDTERISARTTTRPYDESTLRNLAERRAVKVAEVQAIQAEQMPLHAEFTRRGGWTRAWLVQNHGGHVHNSMACSTCYPTTRFGWLPQVSGKDEAEIVSLAGEGACTVCYPSAPAVGPLQLATPKQQADKAERDAAKAARDAKRVANSLSADGSVVRVVWEYETWRWEGTERVPFARRAIKEFKTRRAAEIWAVNALAGEEYDSPTPAAIETVLGLLAQRGVDIATLQSKANRKIAQRSN